ncbi:MAG TPA: GNAT family N-acetyltransferase [Dehalococcoidia bacterium]
MGIDIRVLTDEDKERWKLVDKTAFMASDEEAERWARYYQPAWGLGAFIDGELQASVSSIPFTLVLEGSHVRMGGVTSVNSMPEFRRQGLVAELLRETLKRSRDLGESLSGLWTPHPSLYRRYGWEICSDMLRISFAPKSVELQPGAKAGGTIRRLTADEWKTVDAVYRAWGGRRNSLLVRDEVRWRLQVDVPGRVLYLYRNAAGDALGYAILHPSGDYGSRTLRIFELVALTSEAYRALLNLVLSHDLVDSVVWFAPPDEPLLDVVADPGQVKVEQTWALHLRIVDVAEALSKRPVYGDGRLVIAVEDEVCPWNAGTWEVLSAGSRLAADRCDDEPMLTVDPRALAQLYNGYRSATQLALSGRLRPHHPRAVAIADILFAMRTPPCCIDDF